LGPVIETGRLVLRPWRDEDAEPFLRLSSDSEVLRYLGPAPDREAIDARIARQRDHQARLGHCFWAVERRQDGALLGLCGLQPAPPATPVEGEVEIGWQLGRDHWGLGYAREAAAASLGWGWANLGVPRIVSITVPANRRSRGLMERLRMVRRPDLDFLHPRLADGDPLKPHVTYVIDRP
jgi:RimJ/RimL family protein N-acetyltransferase